MWHGTNGHANGHGGVGVSTRAVQIWSEQVSPMMTCRWQCLGYMLALMPHHTCNTLRHTSMPLVTSLQQANYHSFDT